MRTNKNTEIVFLDILSSEDKIGKLDRFIADSDKDDPNMQKYLEIFTSIRHKINQLGDLEEIILQSKAWKNLTAEDVKITVNNDYIYVRAPFYRVNKKAKEIRAILGKTEDSLNLINSKDPEKLYESKEFMENACDKLKDAMLKVIHENADKLKNTYQKCLY